MVVESSDALQNCDAAVRPRSAPPSFARATRSPFDCSWRRDKTHERFYFFAWVVRYSALYRDCRERIDTARAPVFSVDPVALHRTIVIIASESPLKCFGSVPNLRPA